jgi:hypothetical protein
MNDVDKFSSQLLQRNIADTKTQRKELETSIKNTENAEMKKYLESVNKVLKASEELDSFVLKKVSSSQEKTSICQKIAKFLKKIF